MEVEPTILLPGSFNPIHKGHLSIAENVLRAMPEATLWFVVSPQNPLKSPSELAEERHRLQMARIAVGSSPLRERMAVCDVEFTLPKPSLTLRTLDTLQAKYPSRRFALLVGTDIVGEFGRWYRSGEILDRFEVLARNAFRILRRSPLLSDRLPSGKQLRIHRHQRRFRDPDAGRLRDLQQKCHRSLYAVGKRIP